jgi:hypothetical protein
MLLGDSAGLVLGPVPWLRYVELQHLALQKAVELAGHEKQQQMDLLDTRVNEAGEGSCFESAGQVVLYSRCSSRCVHAAITGPFKVVTLFRGP